MESERQLSRNCFGAAFVSVLLSEKGPFGFHRNIVQNVEVLHEVHGFAFDWALGVVVHELVNQSP